MLITFDDYAEIVNEGEEAMESLRKDFEERDKGDFSSVELSDLEAVHTLGKGAAATVTLVRHQVTGRTAALKAISIARALEHGYGRYAAAEASILRSTTHSYADFTALLRAQSMCSWSWSQYLEANSSLMNNEPEITSEEKVSSFISASALTCCATFIG